MRRSELPPVTLIECELEEMTHMKQYFRPLVAILATALPCAIPAAVFAEEAKSTALAAAPVGARTVRVMIYDDEGGKGVGPTNVEKCLSAAAPGTFTFRRVKAADIRAGVLKDADVVVQPGGSGRKQAETLGEEGRENVKAFVKNGGGFIGICAGAYLASSEYPWSLHILNSKVIDRQHWARGKGVVKLRLTADGKTLLGKTDDVVSCDYNQGPLLGRAEEAGLPAYQELATFETEIAEKGAPSGIMKGTTAIAAGTFGQGRVICISPHPERSEGLDVFIRQAAAWTAKAGEPATASVGGR